MIDEGGRAPAMTVTASDGGTTNLAAPGKPLDSDTFDAMNWKMGEPVETFPARFAVLDGILGLS